MTVSVIVGCNHFWGWKNQSFGSNTKKTQPISTKFGTHAEIKSDNVQEILGAIGLVGKKWGLVFRPMNQMQFCQLPIG